MSLIFIIVQYLLIINVIKITFKIKYLKIKMLNYFDLISKIKKLSSENNFSSDFFSIFVRKVKTGEY